MQNVEVLLTGHKAKPLRDIVIGPKWKALTALLTLLAIETTLFGLFAVKALGNIEFSLMHLACSLAAWFMTQSTLNPHPGSETRLLGPTLAISTLLAGPFASVIAVAIVLSRFVSPNSTLGRATPSLEEREASSRPLREQMGTAVLDKRVRLDYQEPATPLLDTFIEGGQLDKLEVLSIIAKKFDPAMAPILLVALRDPDAPVRVLAATVVTKLRATHLSRIGAALKETQTAPEATAKWRNLAQARLQLAHSGLLDRAAAAEERARAAENLARADTISDKVPSARA